MAFWRKKPRFFDTLLTAAFHELRARAKNEPNNALLQKWHNSIETHGKARDGRRFDSDGPVLKYLTELDAEKIDVVRRAHEAAKKAEAATKKGAAPPPHSTRLAHAHWALHRYNEEYRKAWGSKKQGHPEIDNYFHAMPHAFALDPLNYRMRAGVANAKIEFSELGVDKHGVTRVKGVLTYDEDDPNQNLDAVVKAHARRADPRRWQLNFPELWLSSYCTGDHCENRQAYAEPDERDTGDVKLGLFYERGHLGLLGFPVIESAVLLNLAFTQDAKRPVPKPWDPYNDKVEGQIHLAYNLHESLFTSFFSCLVSPGGLDIDREPTGGGLDVLIEAGKRKRRRVRIRTGKHLRYSQDTHFSGELNLISLPLWYVAVTNGLIQSIQNQGS